LREFLCAKEINLKRAKKNKQTKTHKLYIRENKIKKMERKEKYLKV